MILRFQCHTRIFKDEMIWCLGFALKCWPWSWVMGTWRFIILVSKFWHSINEKICKPHNWIYNASSKNEVTKNIKNENSKYFNCPSLHVRAAGIHEQKGWQGRERAVALRQELVANLMWKVKKKDSSCQKLWVDRQWSALKSCRSAVFHLLRK